MPGIMVSWVIGNVLGAFHYTYVESRVNVHQLILTRNQIATTHHGQEFK